MSGFVLVSDITGNTTDVYVDPENNNQIVTLIQLNSIESKLLLKDFSLSTQAHSAIKEFLVYPNPLTDELKIIFGDNFTVPLRIVMFVFIIFKDFWLTRLMVKWSTIPSV